MQTMRRRIQREIFLLLCLLVFVPVQGQTYEELWAQVEEAQKKGLVQTANRPLHKLYQKAAKARVFPQMTRALLLRYAFLAEAGRGKPYELMAQIRRWGERWNEPADKRVLQFMLGCLYMSYDNRVYRGASYSETQQADDPSKWDGPTFRRRALACFDRALDDFDFLAYVNARTYEPLLVPGADSRFFHDDLLSVMAEEVLEWTGSRDRTYTLNLYDRLADYYAEAGNRDAELWWKYARTAYLLNHDDDLSPQAEDKRLARYYREVDALLAEYADTDILPRIYEDLLRCSDDVERTFRWTQDASRRYPHYKRAGVFENAFRQLTLPYLDISVRNVQTLGVPVTYEVNYRNVDTLRWELYDLASGRLVGTEVHKLRVERDSLYVYRDTILSLPALAHPGRYKVRFRFCDRQQEATFMLNRLNAYHRILPDGRLQVFVLDRESGHPVPDACVTCIRGTHESRNVSRGVWRRWWTCDYREEQTTGEDGSVTFLPDTVKGDWGICAAREDLGTTDTLKVYWSAPDKERWQEDGYIFTDRAIYRPGQQVFFSGFLYQTMGIRSRVIPSRKLMVYLQGLRSNIIDSLTVTTNEFGSFSGTFTMPRRMLAGRCRIQIPGMTSCLFSVEEYKRPTFSVELDKPKDACVLGDSIRVDGRALTFSGVPVSGASVRYSLWAVPHWWTWLLKSAASRSIAFGEAVTDADGRFQISTCLKDIRSSASDDDGCVSYNLRVEVTTDAGETQPASQVILVGNRSLNLQLLVEDKWMKEHVKPQYIVAENSVGQLVEVEGECVFYRVRESGKSDRMTEDSLYSAPFSTKDAFMPGKVRQLPSGQYNLEFHTTDDMGRPVVERKSITLFSMADRKIPVDKLGWYYIDKHKLGTGKETTLLLGTSAKDAYLIYDVFAKGKVLESKRILVSDSLLTFRFPDRSEYGDGIIITWFMVKHGEVFEGSESIPRVYSDRLQLKWKTFRDRLRPGEQEEWQLQVTDAEGRPVDAELMATLYDASLNRIAFHSWHLLLGLRSLDLPRVSMRGADAGAQSLYFDFKVPECHVPDWGLNHWDALLRRRMTYLHKGPEWGTEVNRAIVELGTTGHNPYRQNSVFFQVEEDIAYRSSYWRNRTNTFMRGDFRETAFFYPHLRTNEKGEITLSFTLPESLTTWRFIGLAHTRDMKYGLLEGKATASKEFMLQEYLPRYVRSGDHATLSALLTNLSGKRVKGTVCMELFDPQTDTLVLRREQSFALESKGRATIDFACRIPESSRVLACRMMAESRHCSDGEQRHLPVLPKQEPLLTSRSFTLTRGGVHEWSLDSLFARESLSAGGKRELTFEIVSRPEWLAVSALPALVAPAREDAISLAAAYYACRLGGWLLRQHPSLRQVLTEWKEELATSGAKSNPLEANSELAEVLLEETPWADALPGNAELQRRLSLLLDEQRLETQAGIYLDKLKFLQKARLGFSWTDGWSSNRTVTVVVTELLARLHRLTGGAYAKEYEHMLDQALSYSSIVLNGDYMRFKTWEADTGRQMYVYEVQMHDLYARALFGNMPEDDNYSEMFAYYYRRMKANRDKLTIVGRAAAVSIALAYGEEDVAREFWQSLMEHSVFDVGQGRYFNTPVSIASWTDCRIPTQVMVLEAGQALGVSDEVLSPFRQWLMLQKQTQSWDNPYHTANAVYALLSDGQGRFDGDASSVTLRLDGQVLGRGDGHRVEADVTLEKGKPSPRLFTVEMPADDDGLAWGAVYLRSNPEGEVRPEGNGVSLERTLWFQRRDDRTGEWQEWTGKEVLQPGDRVRSCLQVSASRNLDFVQLTDRMAACLEVSDAKSRAVWSEDVCAYRAVKDASVHYFISYLTKGVHQWTTDYIVARAGAYRLGVATVQSMYAPQWRAHTDAATLTIESDAQSEKEK